MTVVSPPPVPASLDPAKWPEGLPRPPLRKVLIIGASRGIGLALVTRFLSLGAQVVATARSESGLAALEARGARALRLDVAQAASVSGLSWQIEGERFDAVVLNAGVYGPHTMGLDAPTQAAFDEVMHTNVLAAMRLLPQIAEALAPGARVAVVSSRMGLISERQAHQGWLYRASKAALNSVLKDASLVLGRDAVCVALHPGWVQTDMGGTGADLTPERSASDLCAVIAGLSAADNGSFKNHDGRTLAW